MEDGSMYYISIFSSIVDDDLCKFLECQKDYKITDMFEKIELMNQNIKEIVKISKYIISVDKNKKEIKECMMDISIFTTLMITTLRKDMEIFIEDSTYFKILKEFSDQTWLFSKKNKDYGSSFEICGLVGVITRLIEKFNRIITIHRINEINVEEETVIDTLRDISIYTKIARIIIICDENENEN